MSTYLLLFIGLANIIAILLIYYSFGKDFDKSKRLIGSMISVGFMYILVLVVYQLSKIGLDSSLITNNSKTYITMAFVPVNSILFMPYLIHSYAKVQAKQLDSDVLKKRIIIVAIIALIVCIGEFFYFRSFSKGIIRIQEQLQINNEISANELNTVGSNNEITNNENVTNTTNGISVNNTNNTISNSTNTSSNTVANNTVNTQHLTNAIK